MGRVRNARFKTLIPIRVPSGTRPAFGRSTACLWLRLVAAVLNQMGWEVQFLVHFVNKYTGTQVCVYAGSVYTDASVLGHLCEQPRGLAAS
jgi:hypothetical protein